MKVIQCFELVDNILEDYENVIGKDLLPYKNHVYRMINFVVALAKITMRDLTEEQLQKVQIAAAFHDIGIWTKNTVDYIDPSVLEAVSWMRSASAEKNLGRKLSNDGIEEISDMIEWHHKVSAIKDNKSPLPELFRQGDLVDFSFSLVRNGLLRTHIKEVKRTFANAGFHKKLMKLSVKRLLCHPLDPAPMMRR